jgi:hypothetical protein
MSCKAIDGGTIAICERQLCASRCWFDREATLPVVWKCWIADHSQIDLDFVCGL